MGRDDTTPQPKTLLKGVMRPHFGMAIENRNYFPKKYLLCQRYDDDVLMKSDVLGLKSLEAWFNIGITYGRELSICQKDIIPRSIGIFYHEISSFRSILPPPQ